jgi:predicted nucleic acid-binding protein
VILVDTAALLEGLDASAPQHEAVRDFLNRSNEPLLLSPLVLAELDYFLRDRIGQSAQVDFLKEVEAGSYELQLFDSGDLTEARSIIEQYASLGISLADASIVVLARRFRVNRVLTFDGHFRTISPASGSFFVLLPTDEP